MRKDLFNRWVLPKYEKGDVGYNRETNRLTFKPGVFEELGRDYPDKDVINERRAAERWILLNGPKRNWTRFFVNWLSRSKERLYNPERKILSRFDPAENVSPTTSAFIAPLLSKFKIQR